MLRPMELAPRHGACADVQPTHVLLDSSPSWTSPVSFIIHHTYQLSYLQCISPIRSARARLNQTACVNFFTFASFFSFSLYVLFLLFLTILHDPACPLLHHTLHTPHLDLSSYTNHIFKSLVLFFLFQVHQDITSQFCCHLPLNLNLFLPYVHCSRPACP